MIKSTLTIVVVTFSVLTAARPAIGFDHLATGRTYDSEVSIEKRYPHTRGGHQIWLKNSKAGTEALLYTTKRNAAPMFSTNMNWLVINDAEGSGSTRCKLFRRKGGKGSVNFELVDDLTPLAWKFFQTKTGRDPAGLHHDYVRARCWLADPDLIVMSLIGHGDPGHYRVRYWTCFFDPDSGDFSVNLGEVNDERVQDSENR